MLFYKRNVYLYLEYFETITQSVTQSQSCGTPGGTEYVLFYCYSRAGVVCYSVISVIKCVNNKLMFLQKFLRSRSTSNMLSNRLIYYTVGDCSRLYSVHLFLCKEDRVCFTNAPCHRACASSSRLKNKFCPVA